MTFKEKEINHDSFGTNNSLKSSSSSDVDLGNDQKQGATFRMPYIDKCKPTESVIKQVEQKYQSNFGHLNLPQARQKTFRLSEVLTNQALVKPEELS